MRNMANQLKSFGIDWISLVKAGANKQPIQIFKSATATAEPGEETQGHQEPQIELTKEDKGFLQKLRSLLTISKSEPGVTEEVVVEKAIKDFNAEINNLSDNIWKATSKLEWVLFNIAYSEEENKLALMDTSIGQFQNYIKEICAKVGITKAIEGSPTSVSMTKGVESLQGLMTEMQKMAVVGISVPVVKEENDVAITKEEIMEMLAPITKSLADLSTEVQTMKAAPPVADPVPVVEEVKPTVEGVTKADLTDAMTGISASIETLVAKVAAIENTVGAPAAGGTPAPVEKAKDIWDGIFPELG